MKYFAEDKKFISKFVPKTLGSGLSAYLSREDEKKLLQEVSSFLEKEFGASIELTTAEEKELNSPSIIPGRPGIVLE